MLVTPTRNSARRRSAFTLLEVLVALVIIATAFVALLGLHTRNLRVTAREAAYTSSLFLARELIAEAELGGFPDLGTSNGNFDERHPGGFVGYTWERIVTGTPFPQLREVEVRVQPPAEPSAACSLTLLLRDS